MTDICYWTSEYDWEVLPRFGLRAPSRENVLCVLFDCGVQCQFSSVRITLLCSSDITPRHHEAWQIKPCSPPLSFVNRVSSDSMDIPTPQNDPSLPVCNIAFMADLHSARSQTISRVASICGELVLTDAGSLKDTDTNIIFAFDQPLTEITQSVSVSFTSSRLLCTMIPRGVFSEPVDDQSATANRVVRVLPNVPMSKRTTIFLPVDVLLHIFENLRFPTSYYSWRQDILSSALVCREWTCALGLLSVDFRSEKDQQGYPPEISSLAHALVKRPSLGLGIKYLSNGYLRKHPNWDLHPSILMGCPSPMFSAMLRLQQGDSRRLVFDEAFLVILSAARNLQTLCFDQGSIDERLDLASALRGLNKLETCRGQYTLTMAQLISCVATWPSLKHLSVLRVPPSVAADPIYPLPLPTCSLTSLDLSLVPIKDEELMCLVSASGSTLEQLSLGGISELTNAGLGAALNAVCKSLSYLAITSGTFQRDRNEEPALDATITRMERLMMLKICMGVASERMVERRAEAFQQCKTPGLSEVWLCLIGPEYKESGLVAAARRVWPGWKMVPRSEL